MPQYIDDTRGSMDRIDILKYLVKRYNYKSFLEIGVHGGYYAYNEIDTLIKDGVDISPGGPANYVMSSDEFRHMLVCDEYTYEDFKKYDRNDW